MSAQSPIQNLISCLSRLPGIGEKTATRLALHIVNCSRETAMELAQSIRDAREKIALCSICFNYTDRDTCSICSSSGRDPSTICVVETPGDLMAIERSSGYSGRYHVLHGVISPIDGIGPDQLRIKELIQRASDPGVHEVVLATNPTMSGNATAAYIAEQLKSAGVKITQLAQGIPAGGDLEYADQQTLKSAFTGRRDVV